MGKGDDIENIRCARRANVYQQEEGESECKNSTDEARGDCCL
jgi:hypothetical protein